MQFFLRKTLCLMLAILVAIALIFVTGLRAENSGQSFQPDPFYLNEAGIRDTGNRDTTGKALRNLTINPAIRNLVLFYGGQSNAEGANSTSYTPTNASAIDNLNQYDDGIYPPVEPLLGSGAHPLGNVAYGYHPALVLADALITAGKFDRVIIVPFALGGSTIADWTTGVLGNPSRLAVAINRAAQRGIIAGTNVTFVLCWAQGESDNVSGTTTANYTAGFNALVAQAVAAGWPATARILIAKQTFDAGTLSTAVQTAQTSASPTGVINNSASPPIYLGANSDFFVGNICNGTSACRQSDNTHYTTNAVLSVISDATNGWVQALHATGAPF